MATTDDREYQDAPVSVPPPAVTFPTEFPFNELTWGDFERLCQEIAIRLGFENVHRYGRPGQAQEGIDFTGVSPAGVRTAFQVKRKEKLTEGELEAAVQAYAKGRTESKVVGRTCVFIVCLSIEANEQKLQTKLVNLDAQYPFPIEVWDSAKLTHNLRDQEALVRGYFGEVWANSYFGTPQVSSHSLAPEVSEALRIGPVEAFGLTAKVEEAERLAPTSPTPAADVYGEVADELREHFPGYANHFDLLRAKSLKDAGNADASHDALMELAVCNLVEQAEPQIFPGVASALRDLHNDVDEIRQARADAVRFFEQWYEQPHVLKNLAQCFDTLGPNDEYAPVIAMLIAEAAVADCEFGILLDRMERLQRASERCDKSDDKQKQTALRINLAMADAGVEGAGTDLSRQAESLKLPAPENAYVLLRTARRSVWEGELERAEWQYRMAMKFGADADLDLDVEKALWSLTALSAIRTIEPDTVERFHEHGETNQLALAIQGSRSYVTVNPRTRERAFGHLVNERLPDAHLWIRFRLIESIRSGSLMDEFDSRALLARLYDQSDEHLSALEQGLLGRISDNHVKELSSKLDAWPDPDFLTEMVNSRALWVRRGALISLEQLGDLAPIQTARRLARTLIEQLQENAEDRWTAPATFQALQAVVLEADESDLVQLVPVLERFAPREPNSYRLTDRGVSLVAARLYRFQPAFRRRAASVLAEMAAGNSNDLVRALYECGDDLGELVAALERIAEREGRDQSWLLSDLGHPNAGTRALWSNRLQFVAQYPLGKRSEHTLGSRYDVPAQFLEEQGSEVVNRYIQKVVAIGGNCHEPNTNRVSALGSAAIVVELLSADRKRELFAIVKPLTDPETRVSAVDEYGAGTLHPLSRFRISFGTSADVRAAAFRVLAHSAVGPEDRADVVAMARRWLGAELEVLQRTGATVLSLPHLSSTDVRGTDLADHPNPRVRQAVVNLPNMRQCPDSAVLDRLASDPHKSVRIRVAYALAWLRDVAPAAYARIGSRLSCDQSGMVRALAAEVLASANQQEA